jgi:hypothetical protein
MNINRILELLGKAYHDPSLPSWAVPVLQAIKEIALEIEKQEDYQREQREQE